MLDASAFNHLQPATAPGDTPRCRSIGGPRWACCYTHPQAERWANSNLQAAGYTTFLPLQAVRRRDPATPTMLHTVEIPLFCRYLFVQFDHHAASWSPIRNAPGVVDLIRTGTEVHYASNADIALLQATAGARKRLQGSQWVPGTPCSLVERTPLAGLPGVVVDVVGEAITVAVLFLGQLRRLPVHASQLVPRDSAG